MAAETRYVLTERLEGHNYATWKFRIQLHLQNKDLWKVISDTPPLPTASNEDRERWKKADTEAMDIMVQSLSSQQTSYVVNQSTARGIWEKLEQVNRGRLIEKRLSLKRNFHAMKWEKDDAVTSYMQRVESIVEQLRTLGENVEEAEVVSVALGGLPKRYYSVARSFDICDASTLTVEKLRHALLQEERRQSSSEGENHLAYRARVRCYKCSRFGHIAKFCRSGENPQKDLSVQKDKPNNGNRKPNNHRARVAREEDMDGSEGNSTQERIGYAMKAYGPIDQATDGKAADWIIDSGATSHMTGNKNLLQNFEASEPNVIILADGEHKNAEGTGSVYFSPRESDIQGLLKAEQVLYVPGLQDNLLSVTKLVENGLHVHFDKKGCEARNKDKLIFNGVRDGGLFKINAQVIQAKAGTATTKTKPHEQATTLWHRRMGHINETYLRKMSEQHSVRGLPVINGDLETCHECIKGKHCREPFPAVKGESTRDLLDLLHLDTWGPVPVKSLAGSRYFVVIIDDYSRYMQVRFVSTKDEIPEQIIQVIKQAERSTGKRVKAIRSDNGGEFVNAHLKGFLQEQGIRHELTVPGSPAQNGVSERSIRTLLDAARTMLVDSELPASFWAESVYTACYLHNRSLTKSHATLTPYERWHKRKPTVAYLRVFGCVTYSWIPRQYRSKLDARSQACILVGYSETNKAYRLCDPVTKRVFLSRDPKFIENQKGSTLLRSESSGEYLSGQDPFTTGEHGEVHIDQDCDIAEHHVPGDTIPLDTEAVYDSVSDDTDCNLRRSTRQATPVQPLQVDPRKKSYADHVKDYAVPQSYTEAVCSSEGDKWQVAINEELNSHTELGTWTIVDRPKDKPVINSKWVFNVKNEGDNDVKFKARLVATGCQQKFGIDPWDTYSPVIRVSSLRLLLALAVQNDLILNQYDVKTAYLHGVLKEETYMEVPEGYNNGLKNKVCKLHKAIYGLRQSGRTWYDTLCEIMSKHGLKRLESEKCLFVWKGGDASFAIIGVYVDDMIVAATDTNTMKHIESLLIADLNLKNLGTPRKILNIHITHGDDGTLCLDQSAYIESVLKTFHMEDCKPVSTPLPIGTKLEKNTGELPDLPYQSLIGSLMYIAQSTRPDIAFSLAYLSQFNHAYTPAHWKAAKHVLRYLKGSIDTKLCYKKEGQTIIQGYSDASWNNCYDGKSTSGFAFVMNGGAITWKAYKQSTVALSTRESEYIALSDAAKEGLWLKNLIHELGFDKLMETVSLHCDNQSTIALVNNNVQSHRTKHLSLKHHFMHELVVKKDLCLHYVESHSNVADIFTKPLTKENHKFCCCNLGLSDQKTIT